MSVPPDPPPGPPEPRGRPDFVPGSPYPGSSQPSPPYAGQPSPPPQQGRPPWQPATPGPWAPTLQPMAGLASATVVVSAVYLAFSWLAALLAFPAAGRYREASDALDVFTAYDAVSVASVLPALAAWIVTSLWLGAARTNAVTLRPDLPHTHGPAWVWLGWVVPVVSLWFPYQVVRDLWRVSGPVDRSLLGWWWGTWVAGPVIMVVAGAFVPFSGPAGSSVNALGPTAVLGAAVVTVSFVLWVRIVRTITAGQRRLGQQGRAGLR